MLMLLSFAAWFYSNCMNKKKVVHLSVKSNNCVNLQSGIEIEIRMHYIKKNIQK